MCEAAAERAAHADRVMRDVPHDGGQHDPERTIDDRAMELGMAHAGADAQRAIPDRQTVEPGDGVDVDQVCRAGEAKGHHRCEALPARQYPAVSRRELSEEPQRLV